MSKVFSLDEVARHNKPDDLWIIIDGKVYDVSKFYRIHPGGSKILARVAGTDASEEFHLLHSDYLLIKYQKLCIGVLSTTVAGEVKAQKQSQKNTNLVPFGDPYWYDGNLKSPFYNETHRKLRQQVRAFVEKEISPYVHEWDEAGDFPSDLYERGYKAGIFGPGWPVEYGGLESEYKWDTFHRLIVTDELARAAAGGVIVAALIHGIGLPPVLRFGSEELKQRIAPDVIKGKKVICLAISEPTAGSDVAHLRTTAKKEGDYYIVNGEKKFITGGCKSDYFTVAVRTGEEGYGGVSLLVIEKGSPGFTIRRLKTQGWWASNTAFLTFNDVKVPAKNLIGEENQGFLYIMFNFNSERFGAAVQANRYARICLEESIKYARKRKTFNKRLIDHQTIRHKLAEMTRRIESTHAWIEILCYQIEKGKGDRALGGPLALCKVQATTTFEYCCREASQIFGGASYIRDGIGEKIERLYREVRVMSIGGGSEEIMRDLAMRQSRL